MRQVNYVIQLQTGRLFVACTTPKIDGDRYDAVFESFANSIADAAGDSGWAEIRRP